MLVLSRRVGETIVIDGNIQVTVVAVQGDKIRLGITAPASIPVDRQEVHERRAAFDPRSHSADIPGVLPLPRRHVAAN